MSDLKTAAPGADAADDDFARQFALTQRFTLGEPRNLTLFDSFGLFLRSDAGDDPTHHLWMVDLDTGTETKLVDANLVSGDVESDLPAAERARRERLREGGAGITAYAADRSGRSIAFALAGRLFRVVLGVRNDAEVYAIDTPAPVFDPRPSPNGDLIAFVSERRLMVVDTDGTLRADIGDDDSNVSWGDADFIAAEEMGRYRGFWWAPDQDRLAICRNDVADVERWWIAEPSDPSVEPSMHHYPQAGTANPSVELYLASVTADSPFPDLVRVEWDRARFEYLAGVTWNDDGLTIGVQSRDQRSLSWLRVRPDDGTTQEWLNDTDPTWVELVPGSGSTRRIDVPVGSDPSAHGDTRSDGHVQLITAADRDGARRLLADGSPVSPPEVQVRSIIAADHTGVLVSGNPIDDSTVLHLYRWDDDGFNAVTSDPGLQVAVGSPGRFAIRRSSESTPGAVWELPGGHRLSSVAETPTVVPRPVFLQTGPHRCATAVLLPADHDGSPLPVLMDPYGGPHALRALRSYQALTASQWFADQGFAVVITDGRGTPGRGTAYERAVSGDLASAVLEDQITGLHDAAEQIGVLDLGRVAIRGWSFGGYLAALAVLKRPDVFHAGVAGAPVTEWHWYDTHYTERYLGNPVVDPGPYERSSLLALAPDLQRPLLLIHGLADDNVVAAHTLALSSALLAAGRSHEVLPLSRVTHMTPQIDVAKNLLLHQLAFIRRHLATDALA